MILRLLTLPVAGPLWVVRQVVNAAEDEYYDEANILRELAECDTRHRAGELSEAEFREAEEALAERLAFARQRTG